MGIKVIEGCAGTAGWSVRLQGGRSANTINSRFGSKRGFAEIICKEIGLEQGQGADAYVWVEPDPGMANVLKCYPDPDRLHQVADEIRSWDHIEPRSLWEALRRWDEVIEGRNVAGWLVSHIWSVGQTDANSYAGPGKITKTGRKPFGDSATCGNIAKRVDKMARIKWPHVLVLNQKIEEIDFGQLDKSWIVYLDVPYSGTHGYDEDLPRPLVLDVARRFDAADACVIISEGVPLYELGWETVEITKGRRGARRQFGNAEEWLMMNRAAAMRRFM